MSSVKISVHASNIVDRCCLYVNFTSLIFMASFLVHNLYVVCFQSTLVDNSKVMHIVVFHRDLQYGQKEACVSECVVS